MGYSLWKVTDDAAKTFSMKKIFGTALITTATICHSDPVVAEEEPHSHDRDAETTIIGS
jgi:hypothetical protein